MGRAFVPQDTETTKPPDPMSGGFFDQHGQSEAGQWRPGAGQCPPPPLPMTNPMPSRLTVGNSPVRASGHGLSPARVGRNKSIGFPAAATVTPGRSSVPDPAPSIGSDASIIRGSLAKSMPSMNDTSAGAGSRTSESEDPAVPLVSGAGSTATVTGVSGGASVRPNSRSDATPSPPMSEFTVVRSRPESAPWSPPALPSAQPMAYHANGSTNTLVILGTSSSRQSWLLILW